jgi:hypothetical protein
MPSTAFSVWYGDPEKDRRDTVEQARGRQAIGCLRVVGRPSSRGEEQSRYLHLFLSLYYSRTGLGKHEPSEAAPYALSPVLSATAFSQQAPSGRVAKLNH